MTFIRAALLAALCLPLALGPAAAPAQQPTFQMAQLAGGTVRNVRIEGNQRIEEATIRSYMLVRPGDAFDPEQLDRTLKTLYATGLFRDVGLRREGDVLMVRVAEYPIVNRIALEGNKQVTDETLKPEMQLRPRAVFSEALARADRQRLLDLYARKGRYAARVEPKVIQLDQNRVDVVFEIDEGPSTLTSRIAFVGNRAFSEGKLGDVISSREQAWWRFLSTSDNYDPDRVAYDKEQLRKFYLSKGYADVEIAAATAELAPDRSSFFITYTINEGQRYTVSKISANVTLKGETNEAVTPQLPLDEGDWYDGDAIERSIQDIAEFLQGRGHPFVDVKPRILRDREKHTVEIVYDVSEGQHVYVERIDITGNVRTQDKVIRRELRIAEGDPFNGPQVRLSRQRLDDLEFFGKVDITPQPGSAPDRVILDARVEEKATGQFTIGGGYSTDIGALATLGVREKNIIGTGIDAAFNTVLAQKQTQVNIGVNDPYFLDRNLFAGADVFHIIQNNRDIADYYERRTGMALRVGYDFSEHLRQLISYTIVQRNVYKIGPTASIYVIDAKGESVLSQISQTLTLDYRDSRIDPHKGWVARLGTDYAGLGGDTNFARAKFDVAAYIPLERYLGSSDWVIAILGSVGQMYTFGKNERIIDRYFLGGDNLRGFQTGGVGPHTVAFPNESVGGKFIWTQSTELRFPLPISADLGVTGRTFVDVGSLSQLRTLFQNGLPVKVSNDSGPRVAAGVGISWKTPFGLMNIDVAQPLIKKKFDQTQLIRLGFGTRF